MILRLPYRAFGRVKVAPPLLPPGAPSIRYRPVIPLRMLVPGVSSPGVFIGDAFADPGTDLTIVQHGFLGALGVTSFMHQMNQRWQGVNYRVRFALLQLELSDGSAAMSWPATIGFTEAPIPYSCLLGLTGFFEFFDVRFLGSDRWLEIEPNSLFHQIGGWEVLS